MDAIELLTQQHRDVEHLFDEIREADSTDRSSLLEELADSLTIHATIEERIFYPGVKRDETAALLEHSVEEHLEVKRTLADMLDRDTEDDDTIYGEPLEKLIKEFTDHAQEEEHQLFPKVRSLFEAGYITQLGDRMVKLVNELESEEDVSGHIYDETDAPAQI
jgi:hemerythrin superfamily protein